MEVVLEPHQHASVMKNATNVLIVVVTYRAYAMKVTIKIDDCVWHILV